MPTLSPAGTIEDVTVRGNNLTRLVSAELLEVRVEMSTSAVAEIELRLPDPDLRILASGVLAKGGAVDFADVFGTVAVVEVDGSGEGAPQLVVRARAAALQRLRERTGTLVMNAVSPTQFARAEAEAAGLVFVGEDSAQRETVSRAPTGSPPEQADDFNSWDAIQRLAGELGYLAFETLGVLYFGRPTWLVAQGETVVVRWPAADVDAGELEPLRCPSARSSVDADEEATLELEFLPTSAAQSLRPGQALEVFGVPTFENVKYLVTDVELTLDNVTPVRVSCATPVDPEVLSEDQATLSSLGVQTLDFGLTGLFSPSLPEGSGPTGDIAAGSSESFVQLALAQVGNIYVLGAEANPDNPNPSAFDCSELVQWASMRAGIPIPDGAWSQSVYCHAITVDQAISIRGALLFHVLGPTFGNGGGNHVAISLGNGRTVEARGRAYGVVEGPTGGRGWNKGGLIPGMYYGNSGLPPGAL